MAQTFLLFEFGSDEEGAQKARHRLDGWKQAFRLGDKVQFKVERTQSAKTKSSEREVAKEKEKSGDLQNDRIRLFVRLDFSAHEKTLYHTWLERIPAEEPFKSVNSRSVDRSSGEFEKTSELFRNLD